MSNCDDLYCARIRECIENPDYTTWTKQWCKNVSTDWNDGNTISFGVTFFQYNETLDVIIMCYEGGMERVKTTLSTGVPDGVISEIASGGAAEHSHPLSSLGKYYCEVVDTGSTYNLLIFKDTTLIQTIDLIAAIGTSYTTGKAFLIAISNDGKYIIVSGPNWFVSNSYVILFVGS